MLLTLRRISAPTLVFAAVCASIACSARQESEPSLLAEAQLAPQSSDNGTQVSCPPGMVRIAAATLPPFGGNRFRGVDPHGEITLDPFCIDATEVTVADYARCVEAGSCQQPRSTISYSGTGSAQARSPWCNAARDAVERHPINCVDWNEATAYCTWRGARLPTDLEWELAARGPQGRRQPWGDEPLDETRANLCGLETSTEAVTGSDRASFDDGWEGTAPVRAFPAGATPEGVFALGGNVAEWCSPRQRRTIDRRPQRGGAWSDADVASRIVGALVNLHDRDEFTGFRCAADVEHQ